uniref:Uncharacterized protein n=1 Tax=Brassica oleracea TaxID=3712 RepID=A0A3P6HCA5_BRAOL|nr:unnamed protein product [Brassica oleracea]
MAERANPIEVIDGTAIKRLISRLIDHFGMAYTSHPRSSKDSGFPTSNCYIHFIRIDDLLTIPSKGWLVQDAEQQKFDFGKTPSLWECTCGRKNYANLLRYGMLQVNICDRK